MVYAQRMISQNRLDSALGAKTLITRENGVLVVWSKISFFDVAKSEVTRERDPQKSIVKNTETIHNTFRNMPIKDSQSWL